MQRRTFLRSASITTVVVLGGGVFYADQRGALAPATGPAYAPWDTWDESTGPLALVRAGILASSPHNTQPWRFRVEELPGGNASVSLYADATRALGAMDPFGREMHLGLGCAVENMTLAAAAGGYACDVTLTSGALHAAPAGGDATEPVATLRLRPGRGRPGRGVAPDLYAAIPHRHTHRGAYAGSVSPATLGVLQGEAAEPGVELHLLTSAADRAAFSRHTLAATEAIIADSAMSADSHRWSRLSTAASERHRDGVTLEGVGLDPVTLRAAKLLPPLSGRDSDEKWLESTRERHLPTAAAFGLLTVPDRYDRQWCLRAGRVWQRLHLRATALGLQAQPLNQLVELADRDRILGQAGAVDRALASMLPEGAGMATFAFRIGYALRDALPVVRRSVEEVLAETPLPSRGTA